MKDFKKMPKMACGGGVDKYNEGGRTSVDMPSSFGSSKPRTMIVDGKEIPRKPPVEMPNLRQGNKGSSPTVMETKPTTSPRGNLELLKKGGRAKKK